jgi:Tol biopolymer transport system component
MLAVDAGRLQRLPSAGLESSPCFSADGRRLFFTRRTGRTFAIFERDLDSGTERRLVGNAVRGLPTPDGAALLFTRPFDPGLWRFDLGSRRTTRLSAAPGLADRGNWAVAGNGVWVADRDAGRLVRLGLNDGAQTESRPLPALAPTSGLSASGDYLLYAERSPPETDLYVMRRGGR